MGSLEEQFPVPQKKLSLEIKGNKTDVVICAYEDHFFVMATQLETMGTILHARKEEGVSVLPTFNVSVIFGKRDEPMLVACARQLIEHIRCFSKSACDDAIMFSFCVYSNSGSSKPLLLSLGLKDHSTETLKGVVSAVSENGLW
ncbi:hypothetical protein Tsubulata_004743 [Turnera subulata]|uniref:Proteasome assembly chaperone 3 n=1 Tax=Turnera subulata TaxID=218843 RepID=A0A9Q0J8G0_9ROSI|nr:hypothetical protein Tsubulata_004743 [Turnera subulata]